MSVDWNNLFATWYMWLSSLNATLSEPIQGLSDNLGLPLVSAFLFGVLGTTAPCQLSTNFGALAFLARRPSDRGATVRATLAFVGAKMLVYTVLGIVVLINGRQLLSAFGPYLDVPRKIIGPLMVVLGLAVLGVIRVRLQFGQAFATRLERRAKLRLIPHEVKASTVNMASRQPAFTPVTAQPGMRPGAVPNTTIRTTAIASSSAISTMSSSVASTLPSAPAISAPGVWSSFLLGTGFSLAFCPTLLLLFFGVTMALASRSAGGFAFPAFFALGTALPLVVFMGLAFTSAKAAERLRRGMRRANHPLRWIGAIVLILLGMHDTLIYWFL